MGLEPMSDLLSLFLVGQMTDAMSCRDDMAVVHERPSALVLPDPLLGLEPDADHPGPTLVLVAGGHALRNVILAAKFHLT